MPRPVARLADAHTCPALAAAGIPETPIQPPCYPNVLVGGRPIARLGSRAPCVTGQDVVVLVEPPHVLVGGLPVVHMGDPTSLGGTVLTGCLTVLM